jgi:hypothetical protein
MGGQLGFAPCAAQANGSLSLITLIRRMFEDEGWDVEQSLYALGRE